MLVLSHIYLEAKDDRVFISSTDLESSMYSSFPAKINSAGNVCISGKKLFDVVEKLPDEKINVSLTTDSHVEISFSTGKTKLKLFLERIFLKCQNHKILFIEQLKVKF